MRTRRILSTVLLVALASSSAWGAHQITSGAPTSPVFVGQSYSFQFAASAASTWSLASGSLPSGATLSSSGLLSATQLTATGIFDFTVTSTAPSTGAPDVASAGYRITVNNGSVYINQSSFNPKAAVGVAYSNQLSAFGGKTPYSWSFPLASDTHGISISTNGLLSGTPTATGPVRLGVQVSDSAASIDYFEFTLQVIGITTTTLPSGSIGTTYSQTLSSSGGVSGVTWSVTNTAALPPGLAVATNGVIAGTPTTNGTYNFEVRVTDSIGNTTTKTLTIVIGPTITITPTTLSNGTVGSAYSQTFQGTGGTGTLTWSATGLPAGLSMSPSGVLSGTPTAAATTTFTVTVTDANNVTASVNLSLTVVAPQFRITTTSPLPGATVGAPYSQTFAATGASGTFTWSGSGLPVGLSMDSVTGVLSGTPASSGSTTFTVTVTAGSLTATANFVLSIGQPTLTITDVTASCFDKAAYAGRRFPDTERTVPPGCSTNYQYTASGGTAPYTWSATGLPTGVTLNATTGVLSGTFPTSGTASFTVVVTDATQQKGVLSTSVTVLELPQITSHDIIVGGSVAPANLNAGQQPAVVVSIGGTIPFTVRGTLALSFASSVGGDDQLVRFSNGTRTAGFTITPASGGRATFSDGSLAVLTGTTAGTITLSATFSDNSTPANDMTPRPIKTFTYTINATAPVITRVVISNASPTGFTVAVTGYSTPRDMSNALFTLTPTTGTNLAGAAADGTAAITVQLGQAFATWYGTTASNAFGSSFTFTIPFTVSSTGVISGAPIAAIRVSLTNSKGTSNTFGPVNP